MEKCFSVSHGMQERLEFYKLYLPATQKFTSLHERFTSLDAALKKRAEYISRTLRGIRTDTLEWVDKTIVVLVDSQKNIIEGYCGECSQVVDHKIVDPHTARIVCQQCPRVLDPKEL